jgi:hypothetical protein
MPVAVGTGGGSGWEETVLFENATGTATDFSLSESYDNFDYLRFDTIQQSGDNLKRSDMFPVNICDKLVIDNYYNYYMWLSCDDKTNFTVLGADNVSLLKVVGINTGSGGGSGDSIWTEEDGKAVYDGQVTATLDNSEAQSNTAEPKQTLSLRNPNGDDGTGDNNYTSLGFNVADGATSKGFITYSRGGDNKGKFVFSQRTGSDTYATQLIIDGQGFLKLIRDGQEINLNPNYNGDGAVMESNDPVSLVSNSKYGITVDTDGYVTLPNTRPGSGAPANMNMDPEGRIYRLTDVRSIDEVEEAMDKKLAIKDKLIEKLSARLDELEKKVK